MSEGKSYDEQIAARGPRFDFDRQLRGGWRVHRGRRGGVVIWTPFFSLVVRRKP